MNNYVHFDIETIPCQDENYLMELQRKVKAPASYKKRESIDKWLSENRERAALEAMAKTSFDGGRGHVCAISWAINDGPIEVAYAKEVEFERDVIGTFFESLDPYHSTTLVGHNIIGFDLGFLRKRAVYLGVKMPQHTTFPRDPKPWDKSVNDTMVMWAGSAGKISMDELCKILKIEGKNGLDGSMVAGAWSSGDHDKIAEYCKDDVWRTREIHKRFLAAGY